MWLYGSGFPKSLNIGKAVDKKLGNKREVIGTKECGYQVSISKTRKEQGNRPNLTNATKEVIVDKGDTEYEGWGTALKPAHEPIVLARKPLSEKSIVANVLKHKTGGIHIDASRIEYADENDRSGWHKTGGGGKGYMDTSTFKIRKITPEEIQERTKNGRFPANVMHNGLEEDWARYFYCAKASKSEKGDNPHPTVKPLKLMKYLCKLITPKGGTVLDPFMGSGSTGIASKDEGFEFIGIEREKEYFEIAEKRINITSPLESFMK
jgi:site-specific DNA-methyltransferase (adenine-specific)